jgi:hypothetical protein
MKFIHSRKKVERAIKHIHDLNEFVSDFSRSDFYSVTIEKYKGANCVAIKYVKQFPLSAAALIIGDALHNMRSALDILYYRAFAGTTGSADKWTRFPVRDEREELISSINGGLKEKKLLDHSGAIRLRDFLVDIVQPYQAGNWPLWALHDMNIMDKHQLLVPVFKVMQFSGIRLEDERGNIFVADGQPYFTEDSYRFKILREGEFKVHDKGNAATAIVFSSGVPLTNKPVLPALTQLAETVSRTIDVFEMFEVRPITDPEERL